MTMMLERGKDRMTLAELEGVAGLVDSAVGEARRLSGLCEGLGCLVSFDDKDLQTGSFRDVHTLPELLFSLAHSIDTVAAMVEAGDIARFEADKRRQQAEAATEANP